MTNEPSLSEVAEPTTFEPDSAWTFIPPSPASVASGEVSVPPPPLVKSNHTRPEIPPGAAAGALAGVTDLGRFSGLTPTSGTRAVAPDCTGWRVTTAPPWARSGLLSPSRADAPGYREPPAKVSWTLVTTALATPIEGSCSYTKRKITPEARNETAIGMNTTILNAVDQRIRSVNTANIRPRIVPTVGATTTQIAVFRTATKLS